MKECMTEPSQCRTGPGRSNSMAVNPRNQGENKSSKIRGTRNVDASARTSAVNSKRQHWRSVGGNSAVPWHGSLMVLCQSGQRECKGETIRPAAAKMLVAVSRVSLHG